MTAALASALVHFLWQGAAIGVVAALGFSLCRSPRIRYLVGIGALVLMAVAPVATFGVAVRAKASEVHSSSSTVHSALLSQDPGSDTAGIEPGRGTVDRSAPWTVALRLWTSAALERASAEINAKATLVLAVWLCGVALLSARLAWGWIGARRLTRRVTTAASAVVDLGNQLSTRLKIRARIRVVESAFVKVPAVVGAFKPMVLLPAAAMSGLSMEQIEALLAHELAHVRRHDYLVNLLQSAVETLLFYHPAVWLVSRRVRQERELCCDDLALEVCGDRVAYASALADLETLRTIPSPALAATGGSLLSRVRRILGHDEISALAGRSQSLAGVAILASIILLAGGQVARAGAVPDGLEIVDAECCGAHPPLFSREPVLVSPPVVQEPQGVQDRVGGDVASGVQGGVAVPGQGIDRDPHVTVGINPDVANTQTPPPNPNTALTDPIVINLQQKIFDKEMQLSQLITVQKLGPENIQVKVVQTDIDIAKAQLQSRLRQLGVDASTQTVPELPQGSAPVDLETGPTIAIGQIIRLEVVVGQVRQAEFNKDYTVQPDGTIAVPYAGSVRAAGLTTAALQSAIQTNLTSSGTLPGANVTATIETRLAPEPPKGLSVIVQGAIRTPGTQVLRPDRNTLTDAIGAAGGFLSSAGQRIYVKRAGSADQVFLRTELLQGRHNDFKVQDGDNIRVEVAPHFYVTGYVKSGQSEYNWEPGMTLQKAIAIAGGVTEDGALNRIEIQRKDPKSGQFKSIKLDKDRMATPILADDVIKVPKKRM